MRRPLVVVTVLVTLAGCDSETPTRPDASNVVAGIMVTGVDQFTDLNQVHSFRAMARIGGNLPRDVTAEATWSSSDPAVVTVSSRGEATSVGLGKATITASYQLKEGSLDVSVDSPDPVARMVGRYRLAITVAAACRNLPDWAQHREYDATITLSLDKGLTLTVPLRKAAVLDASVTGPRVTFEFGLSRDNQPNFPVPLFSEPVDATWAFWVVGMASGTRRGTTISGPLSGAISAKSDADSITCLRDDHKFSLVRR